MSTKTTTRKKSTTKPRAASKSKSDDKTPAQINAETLANEPKPSDAPQEPQDKPDAETEALAASGSAVTDPDELRKVAAAQDEVRKAELDPRNETQPGITADPPEGDPVDRDTLPDPEKPTVFSSQDMKRTEVEPAEMSLDPETRQRFDDIHNANSTKFNRDPSDTEAKLAQQGLIPPIRR